MKRGLHTLDKTSGLIVAGLLAAMLLLAFLYSRSQLADTEKHSEIVGVISELRELEAEFQRALIVTRYGLVGSYDELVYTNKRLFQQSEQLQVTLGERAWFADIKKPTERYLALLMAQRESLEDFKSHNAVLKNSLQYLPTAVDNFTATLDKVEQQDLIESLHRLVRLILQLNLSSDPQTVDATRQQMVLVNSQLKNSGDFDQEALRLVLRHAELVEEYKAEVDELVQIAFNVPTEAALRDLFNQYLKLYHGIERRASYYRGLTILLAALLTLALAFYMFRITRVSATLKQTIEQLNFQKFALDQHAIVSITDKRGNITYANQRFCDLSKYTHEELMGQNHRLVRSPDTPDELFIDLWSTIRAGKVWRGDIKNRAKDGSVYWVASTIVPFLDKQQRPFQYVSIRTDITQRKQMEKEVIAANRAKSDFLANMSHEIRTPMNAVIGLSHLALKTPLNDKQKDYLEKIQTSATALLSILNDILDFSKIEAGKLNIEHIEFSLQDVVNQVFAMNCLRAEEKGLEVLFYCDARVPQRLIGDPLRLNQILTNLISNAIKFTEQGEIVLRVEVTHQEDNQATLTFSVKDTGIGLSEQQQSRLFESFSQADSSTTRKFGGTGLGLAICKKLVTAMQGCIGVSSETGRGSEFFFSIPFERTATVAQAKNEISLLRGKRALIVDDTESARNIITEALQSLGMQVSATDSGEQALQLLESASAPFDFAIVDWQMPGLDGIETLHQLRAVQAHHKHPLHCVLVTAYSREDALAQIAQHQLTDIAILAKPLSSIALADQLLSFYASASSATHSDLPVSVNAPDDIQHLLGTRVLLVEDNPINQQVANELLEAYGIEVMIAGNGVEALTLLKQHKIDLVLLDIDMPVMDGFETIGHIRANMMWQDLPVIAMTAHAQESIRDKCLQLGMNEHIAKPFDENALFTLLTKWLSSAALESRHMTDVPAGTEPDCVNLDGVDTCAGLRSVRGNRKLYRSLLGQFKDNYSDMDNTLARVMDQADLDTTRRYLHTLRSVAAAIGATELADVAGEFEQHVVKDSEPAALFTCLSKFSIALNVVLTSIEQVLDVAREAEPQGVTGKSVDYTQLPDLLARLEMLLNEADLDAAEQLPLLKPFITSVSQKAAFSALTKAINSFDFDDALQYLHTLKLSLGTSKELSNEE
ncbi:response regulator [Alteromonas lipolytica]|uniref:Sensory/regulatory protein RpfC n=1 Tax=Alteromonas lipolytica TaxID=1856405 RepID=A0A1E8FAL8_9ALTE|nr:response regulator [Alteromonas lipolytica]OFI32950.1 hypothetical protein BFC17_01345 [Alteromonas lipolytica]GGF63963.1 hypothetical protein GCM10011338_15390 [Alteromonas lipolytica]